MRAPPTLIVYNLDRLGDAEGFKSALSFLPEAHTCRLAMGPPWLQTLAHLLHTIMAWLQGDKPIWFSELVERNSYECDAFHLVDSQRIMLHHNEASI